MARREAAPELASCNPFDSAIIYNHMVVDYGHDPVDDLFHTFADATRRDIVMRSLHAEFSVSALATFYPISWAAVQKHVAVPRGQLW
jgi:DNA-binding transcriptional ArsR family regulator